MGIFGCFFIFFMFLGDLMGVHGFNHEPQGFDGGLVPKRTQDGKLQESEIIEASLGVNESCVPMGRIFLKRDEMIGHFGPWEKILG